MKRYCEKCEEDVTEQVKGKKYSMCPFCDYPKIRCNKCKKLQNYENDRCIECNNLLWSDQIGEWEGNGMMEADIETNYGTDEEEFEKWVGRKPKDKDELEMWAYALKKGIDAQIDWDILCECASQEFKEQEKEIK